MLDQTSVTAILLEPLSIIPTTLIPKGAMPHLVEVVLIPLWDIVRTL